MTPEAESLCRLIDQRVNDKRVFEKLTTPPDGTVRIEWTVHMVAMHGKCSGRLYG